MTEPSELIYMSAKQVAEYLDLNEKRSTQWRTIEYYLQPK